MSKVQKYTQGVCEDGAAILLDGSRMTIDEVVSNLNDNIKDIERLKSINKELLQSSINEGTSLRFTIDEQANAVIRLKLIMKGVRDDLVNRANLKGEYHVDCSSSQWIALCEAIQ